MEDWSHKDSDQEDQEAQEGMESMRRTNVSFSIKGTRRKVYLLKRFTLESELSSKCVTSAKTASTLFCGTVSYRTKVVH